jgi:hypothetical protein
MKLTFTQTVFLAAVTAALLAGTETLNAQATGGGGAGGGGRNRGGRNAAGAPAARDAAQFQTRRLERYREQFEVTNDEEWKVVQSRIERVVQAERDARLAGFGGGFRGRNPGGPPADGASGGPGGGNRQGRGAAEANPDLAALQKAVETKAPAEELKAKLAKVRDAVKQKEADLAKAREELRQVLTVRQEAVAVLLGLLR